ncbi:hypothetical protein BJX96DRAFT_153915 [Aspergillus floccosus]
MSPPNNSASKEEIRDYVTRTLVFKFDTSSDFATEHARRWRLGRGSEFLNASLEYLQSIFGVDVGFCLFQSIRDDRDESWQQSFAGIISNCFLTVSAAVFFGSLVMSAISRETKPLYLLSLLFGASLINYAYHRPKRDLRMAFVGTLNVCLGLWALFGRMGV